MTIISGSSVNLDGYIEYNGFRFIGPRFRWTANVRPKYSPDGRTVIANVTTMQVRYMLSDGFNINPNYSSNGVNVGGSLATSTTNMRRALQWARSALLKSGKKLVIYGMGFDLSLNAGDSSTGEPAMFDVDWGPRPLSCEIVPVGNGLIHQVDWTVEWTLPECTAFSGYGHPDYTNENLTANSYVGFPYDMGKKMTNNTNLESMTFNVGYSIDKAGLTTRSIEGQFSIAVHRKSTVTAADPAYQIPYTADEAREIIRPEVPPQFQRMSSTFRLSDDKRSMSFQIVDQELASENAMPFGVVDMQLSHTMSTKGLMLPGNGDIICRLSGFVEVAKGFSKGYAFDRCILIMQERIDVARANFRVQPDAEGNLPFGQSSNVMITEVTITEELYGLRRISFDVGYLIKQGNSNLKFANLIANVGFFEPVGVEKISHEIWQKGFKPTLWHPRGLARLEFQAIDDTIVGPCEGPNGSNTGTQKLPNFLTNGGGSLRYECPEDGVSYLGWQSRIQVVTRHGTVAHQPLRLPASTTTRLSVQNKADKAPLVDQYRTTGQAPMVQTVAANSRISIVLKGKGARLGKPVQIPKISTDKFNSDRLASAQIVPGGSSYDPDKITNAQAGRMGACPIYTSEWELYFTVAISDEVKIADLLGAIEDATILTEDDPNGNKTGGLGDQTSDDIPDAAEDPENLPDND